MKRPIYIVIGTRAQLIKMGPIMRLLEDQKIPYTFLYTQQHKVTIDDLLDNFGIKTPYEAVINRTEEAKSIKLFAGWMFQMLFVLLNPFSRKRVFKNGRGLVITHGDTATAAWAAIYGRTSFCKVMHVESGLRSHNLFKPFPEEITRIITFIFSNYYICPNDWAVGNLKHFPGKKYNVGGNQMYDSLMYALKLINNKNYKSQTTKFNLPEKYALVSIHRYENIFKEEALNHIISLLEKITAQIPLVMVMHPATEKKLKSTGNYDKLNSNPNIILLERQDFLTFVEINTKSEFVYQFNH